MKKVLIPLMLLIVFVFSYFTMSSEQSNSQHTMSKPDTDVKKNVVGITGDGNQSFQGDDEPVNKAKVSASAQPSNQQEELITNLNILTPTSSQQVDRSSEETFVGEEDSETQYTNPIPMEHAMEYFVPKDLRGPGNLGGPPPFPAAAASMPSLQGLGLKAPSPTNSPGNTSTTPSGL